MLEIQTPAASLAEEIAGLPDDLELVVEWFIAHTELVVRATLFDAARGAAQLHGFDRLDDITHEWIREQFGGGKYTVRFRERTGGSKILRSVTFPVIGPKIPREGEAPAPAPAPSSRDSDRLDRLERLLEKSLERGSNPGNDLVGLATAMAAAQNPLLAALAEAKRPSSPDMAGMMDVMMRMMEFARDGNGGGGGYGEVVKNFGAPLLELLNRATGGGVPLPPAVQLAPAPNPSAAAPTGAPGWYAVLQPQLPTLLQLAALHADVEFWAVKTLDLADDAALEWIKFELERRQEFDAEFYQWVPDAVPHRDWMTRFWDALAEEVATLDEEDGDE